jgi:hypothetical protein
MAITTNYQSVLGSPGVNVNTQAPGVNIAPNQMAGLDMSWMAAMAAAAAKRKADEEAYKRQLMEREFALKERAQNAAEEDDAFKRGFALQQAKALEAAANEEVPLWTSQLGGGPGTTVGWAAPSLTRGANSVAAGSVRRKDMGMYPNIQSASMGAIGPSKAELYDPNSPSWYNVTQNGGSYITTSDSASGNGAGASGPGVTRVGVNGPGALPTQEARDAAAFEPYDKYWAARREEEEKKKAALQAQSLGTPAAARPA